MHQEEFIQANIESSGLPTAIGPITAGLPGKIALLFNAVVLSALLTYPVMPWVTRPLRPCLHPKSNNKQMGSLTS